MVVYYRWMYIKDDRTLQVIAWVSVHAFGHMWMFPWGNTVDHAGGRCERTEDYDDLVNYYYFSLGKRTSSYERYTCGHFYRPQLHHPLWAYTPPPGQTPPPGRQPPGQTTPPMQTPLCADSPPLTDNRPPDGHCSGRYASYFNAFLLFFNSNRHNSMGHQ